MDESRAKEATIGWQRMINNLSVEVNACHRKYQLFAQELEASPGWVVNKDRSIEYLQELVQRDGEMVQRLQALEREFEHSAFPGLSAALEDPEEELAREEEFEGVCRPKKNLRFPNDNHTFHLKYPIHGFFVKAVKR
ncbi:hypothetical protein Tco_0742959 [Tanacetum coccineum]